MGSILGVVLHAIGGFAAGSFYIPVKKIQGWKWESAWFILGLTAWLLTPVIMVFLTVRNPSAVIENTPRVAFGYVYLFGLLWGIGGLTFGLSMRYLGISLGMTVALGLCTAFGTLLPPFFNGKSSILFNSGQGLTTLFGILLCLIGIGIVGYAGMLKEKERNAEKKSSIIEEFDFKKGIMVAFISGILSACFAFGLEAGKDISALTSSLGTQELFKNNMVLMYILWGGMTTNGLYSLYLNFRHRSYDNYSDKKLPLKWNYFWAMLGGLTWYLQFFFYGMGTTFIGHEFEFASWSIHMSFIILFSNLWGIYFHEWKGISRKTASILTIGLLIVFVSIMMIGMATNISEFLTHLLS